MAIFDNLFGTQPEYLSGLLGADEAEKLRKQAMTTGLVNSAIALIAQPRNQRFGSALPYIGRALMAGQQAGQGVYSNALQGLETQQKLAEFKRKQEQQQQLQQMIGGITDPNERLFAQLAPEQFVAGKLKPRERKTATVGNVVVDVETGQPIFTGEKELKANPTRERQLGRVKIQEEMLPDGTWREIGRGAMDAPQRPTEKPLYSNTPTDTASGFVYMPTPEGMAKGLKPIDATTGAPATGLVSQKQAKEQEAKQKQQLALESSIGTADAMNEAIGGAKEILQDPYTFTSGLVGKTMSAINAPARTTLEGYIDTLKANLSFEELKAMKAASPTGGALGAISENELRLLGSTVASLNPNMPRDKLLENINKIEKKYAEIKSKAMKDLGREQIIPPGTEMPKQNLSVKDRQALQWANNNPNDPRAQQIKQRLGM
jgi:hypothetical protein